MAYTAAMAMACGLEFGMMVLVVIVAVVVVVTPLLIT